jgi:hypothetical protein
LQPFFMLQKPHHRGHLLEAVDKALPAPKPLAVPKIQFTKREDYGLRHFPLIAFVKSCLAIIAIK